MAALERAIADSATAPKIRRSCTLRLARLRAASVKRPAITTRTKAATPAPTTAAKFEAVQSFNALAAQRTALFRNRRRTRGEQDIFNSMVALMPAAVPTNDDTTAWSNFIAQVDGLLSEIKSIKHP